MVTITKVATMAIKALFYEVALSPKPGLVDRYDKGAHKDMDFFLFIRSIQALAPFFEMYICTGYKHIGSLPELFQKIRKIGQNAEVEMLNSTNNINTHKGANFSFALILGAVGYYIQKERGSNFSLPLSESETSQIFCIVKEMCHGLVSNDFSIVDEKKMSYGEKIYKEYNLTGIRGEAEAGYPTIQTKALPIARTLDKDNQEELLLNTLLILMKVTEDSNLIHRGGISGWKKVQNDSKAILAQNYNLKELVVVLKEYNKELITNHLSPGGSADLLAVTIFFLFLEKKID
ncbi:triphosphoribosyl-dephospho-CoA synthase CitG [Enterococcus casseliflavus]|uniref:triphosphoribosyl-dephospho-CoA synthase CitG n=1 Tax=Enterococcus casseliflavus TaxID=37734 RepID=UPI0018845427|nr:triphosphoribosyl-dephospho-CoA synthase CitG [Enterococcus casseliflavus]MBE9909412.1 triphosphoribosyl-dephospho-CoA synthase CitG [Enterococcus casseliflavus]